MAGSPNVLTNDERTLRESDYNHLHDALISLQDIINALGSRLTAIESGQNVVIPQELLDLINSLLQQVNTLKDQLNQGIADVGAVKDAVDVLQQAAEVSARAAAISYDNSEIIRFLAQEAANNASAAEASAVELLNGADAIRDEVVVAKTDAQTAASQAATSATQSSTSASNSEASAAQALISQNASAASAVDASQSATAAATSETQALTYSTAAETFAQAAEHSALEADASRNLTGLGRGVLANPGFEGERALLGIQDIFPQGWQKSSYFPTAQFEDLGFSAPSGGDEEVRYASHSNYGYLTELTNAWGISKILRFSQATWVKFKLQAWLQALDLPLSIVRTDPTTEVFVGDDDVILRVTAFDAAGVVMASAYSGREAWSDTLTQVLHDAGVTGSFSNTNRTLEWQFNIPTGVDALVVDVLAISCTNTVTSYGNSTGNPNVRLDNFELSTDGSFEELTDGGAYARDQAQVAIHSSQQAQTYATDAQTFAEASEQHSIESNTAKTEAQTAAASAITAQNNAQTYADNANSFAETTQGQVILARALSQFAQYMDVAEGGAFTFNDATTQGWSANADDTVSNASGTALRVTHAVAPADTYIKSSAINFLGNKYNKVKLRITVNAGTLVDLTEARLSYSTSGHAFTNEIGALAADVSVPTSNGEVVVMFDALQADPAVISDWTSSTIIALAFKLGNVPAMVYSIDYIYVLGEDAAAPYQAATAAITAASNANASETLAQQYAEASQTSSVAANTSASNASTSESNAATSASNAAGSAGTATTQAGIATSAATAAGDAATAAGISETNAATSVVDAQGYASSAAQQTIISARVGAGASLTPNPIFEDWTGALPAGYSDYYGNMVASKNSAQAIYGSQALQIVCATSANSAVITHPRAFYSEYLVVEVEVSLVAGSISGSGFYLTWQYSTTPVKVSVPCTSWNYNPATESYSYKAVIRRPASAAGTFTGYDFYLMNNWAAFAESPNPKTLLWHKAIVRLASAEEIRTYNVSDEIEASVTTEVNAVVSSTGVIGAKYGVKVDVNGLVSGFGLLSTANNAAPTSEFTIAADKLKVAYPAGGVNSGQQMFEVGQVNGVTKMVLKGDFYADGSITAKSMLLRDTTNLLQDPYLTKAAAWDIMSGNNTTFQFVKDASPNSANYGNSYYRLNITGAAPTYLLNGNRPIPVKPGDELLFKAVFMNYSATAGSISAILWCKSADGTAISTPGISWSPADPGSYTEKSVAITIPAGVAYVEAGLYANNAITGYYFLGFMGLYRRATAELVVDGAISTNKLQAQSVTASKMKIGGGSNIISFDPYFQDAASWTTTGIAVQSGWGSGTNALYSSGAYQPYYDNNKFSVDPNKDYEIEVVVYQDAGSRFYGVWHFWDYAGNSIDSAPYNSGWAAGGGASSGSNFYFPSYIPSTGAYTSYKMSLGPNASAKIPSNAVYCSFGMLTDYGSSGHRNIVTRAWMSEKTSGTLVVVGTIITDHLIVNAVSQPFVYSANYGDTVHFAGPMTSYLILNAQYCDFSGSYVDGNIRFIFDYLTVGGTPVTSFYAVRTTYPATLASDLSNGTILSVVRFSDFAGSGYMVNLPFVDVPPAAGGYYYWPVLRSTTSSMGNGRVTSVVNSVLLHKR